MNGGHQVVLKEAQKYRMQRVDEIKFNVALMVILLLNVRVRCTHLSHIPKHLLIT